MPMETIILFPSQYFESDRPETVFSAEHRAAKDIQGLDVRLCNYDEFDAGAQLRLNRPVGEPASCIWRGWMMLPNQYVRFYEQCRRLNLELITDPCAYELMHCFPNAYKRMAAGDTPHMEVFGDRVLADIVNDAFDAFMMKDFVKSVKQTGFPQCIETPLTQEECDRLSERFIELRGNLYTGGIVCKQYVELKKYAMRTNEWRGFYLRGKLLNLSGNSMQFPVCPRPPADLVGRMEGFDSPFYTVDFGELDDGSWIVLETGDGQVSGLATESTPDVFYRMLDEKLHLTKHPDGMSDFWSINAL